MTGPDLLAPRYMIEVEGTKLREDVTRFISEVTFDEAENQASKITLSVINDRFRFLDSKLFAHGNRLDLWMGYVGKPLRFMGRGHVARMNQSFPRSSSSIPRLTVVAHDQSLKLMNTGNDDKGKTYSKKRDSEIAYSIFRDIGLAPFVFETTGLKTRTRKRGVTRWQFLQRLARIHGFVVYVRYDQDVGADVGYFGPPDAADQPNKYAFTYGTGEADATLLEFRTDVSIPSQSTKVQVVWTDPKTRKTHRLTVETEPNAESSKFTADSAASALSSIPSKRRAGDLKEGLKTGSGVTLTVYGQSEEVVVGRSFKSATEAKRFAAAWFREREREFAFGSGVIVGSPDLRRGHVHEIRGVGTRLGGDWQLTSVSHRMTGESVYEVEFSARKVVLDSVVGSPGNTSKVRDRESVQ